MTDRIMIVVDIESTGLDPAIHVPIEIAAINTATGEELYIAPNVYPENWANADPAALAINRYFERRVFDHIGSTDAEHENAELLAQWLDGNTLAGSNPRFDLGMIAVWFTRFNLKPTAHHRLADLSAYAAGALSIPLTELPGLSEVCALLGVTPPIESGRLPDHTAMGDARATLDCFDALAIRANPKATS